ncbi:hypothetical protein CCMA1212_003220 [Trichoderma ghanense]|uniref:Uncharacterized protein n=1 Tax=Trichoderma ghanense TaxID=65468 RepID=A0ABY2H8Z9_9HYPO
MVSLEPPKQTSQPDPLILNSTPFTILLTTLLLLLFTPILLLNPRQPLILMTIPRALPHRLNRTPLQPLHQSPHKLHEPPRILIPLLHIPQHALPLQLIDPHVKDMQPQSQRNPLLILFIKTPSPKNPLHALHNIAFISPALDNPHLRSKNPSHQQQKLVQAQGLDMRPLRPQHAPKRAGPGLDAGVLQIVHEVRQVGGESLLRAGAVRHPEGVVEACPELAGVEGGERGAGREERLEGCEGFGAHFAVWLDC